MSQVNRVNFKVNLVNEPVLMKAKSGTLYLRMRCALPTYGGKIKEHGKACIFLNAVAFNTIAVELSDSLKKGSEFTLWGEVDVSYWTDKHGKSKEETSYTVYDYEVHNHPKKKPVASAPHSEQKPIEPAPEQEMFECDQCGKSFKTMRGLKTHITKAHGRSAKTKTERLVTA